MDQIRDQYLSKINYLYIIYYIILYIKVYKLMIVITLSSRMMNATLEVLPIEFV